MWNYFLHVVVRNFNNKIQNYFSASTPTVNYIQVVMSPDLI
jgi:exopolysaccharide biosynthesis predicted pyruvyltransferase EpsI